MPPRPVRDRGDRVAIVGDDFAGAALGAQWTDEDPVGDCTTTVSGGLLSIAVPSGVSHDVWSDGINGARVTQPVANTDMEISVKLNATVDTAYQLHGLLFFADADDLIRFDTYYNGTTQRIFAATFVAGSPTVRVDTSISSTAPIYLRVNRTGNTWTYWYSSDGAAWTQAVQFSHTLTLAKVGVFGGNASGASSPAFTMTCDWVSGVLPPRRRGGPRQARHGVGRASFAR